jgi:hypothetical protein
MATGGMTTFRNNLFYVAGAKQSAWNTAITTPVWYHKWLDGTDVIDGAQHQAEREGDTSRYVSLVYKSGQYWGFKVVEYLRPRTAGFVFENFFGSGSDTYTGPTKSTTLSGSGNTAGSTTVVTVGDLGNTSNGYLNITPGLTSATYEVVNVDYTSRTGVGPYTYTLMNSGTLKQSHLAGDAVTSNSKHVFKPNSFQFDPCTYEIGYGVAGQGTRRAIRLTDCVCSDFGLVGDRGKPWRFEHTWIAASGKNLGNTLQASPAYEGTGVIGGGGAPFMFYQGSQWNVNGAATNNAASIVSVSIQGKAGVTWDEHVNESLNPTFFLPGDFDVSGNMTVQFQSYQQYDQMYFGSNNPATNATDSYIVGTESLDLIAQSDGINSLEINLPFTFYNAGRLSPKLDGKPMMQSLSFTGLRPPPQSTFSDPLILTLNNSANAQY